MSSRTLPTAVDPTIERPADPAPSAPPAAPTPGPRGALGAARAALVGVVGAERYRALHTFRWAAARRGEWAAPLPLGFKLAAWRQGFHSRYAAIYDPEGLARGEYVSDYLRDNRCAFINPVPPLFNHKLILRRILADRGGFAQPETIALVSRREIIEDPMGDARRVSAAALEERLVGEGGRYIMKPQVGAFGTSVVLLEVRDGRLVARRGRSVRPFSVARHARPVSMIERAVEAHPFWHALSPASVNTLRILALWTPGDPEPFIARAIQRIGTEETLPTDNWSGGGVCVPVDLTTGHLGTGRVYRFESDYEDRPYTHHPDTNAPITGLVLPGWEHIKAVVLAATRSLPYANYIGWDVAVTPDGTPVFIEGNHNTGVKMLQAHSGLLADPAIRRFYKVCGVI